MDLVGLVWVIHEVVLEAIVRAFEAGVNSYSESAVNCWSCSNRGFRIDVPLFVILFFGRLNNVCLSFIIIWVLIFLVHESWQKSGMLLKILKFLLVWGFDLSLKGIVDVLNPFVFIIFRENNVSNIFVSYITSVTRLRKIASCKPIVACITLDFDPNAIGFHVIFAILVFLERMLTWVYRTNLRPLWAVKTHVLK